jgi:hypothetical protein
MLQKLTAKAVLGGSVLEPYPEYRMAIGVLGVTLPPLLVIGNAGWGLQNSISAYYYTPGRDWFVGILWVIGVFLFFYRYTPQQAGRAKSNMPQIQSGSADTFLGKIAGIAAVLVALFPTYPPAGLSQPPIIGKMHGFAAFILFASLSLFPLVLFSQGKTNVRLYKWCGWLMLLFLGLTGAYALAPEDVRQSLAPWRPVLALEWLLIWTFGVSWFAKGLEQWTTTAPASRRAAAVGS